MRSTTVTLPDKTDTVNPPANQTVFAPSVADFIELVKPRLVVMILITTAAGLLSRGTADRGVAPVPPYPRWRQD